MRSNTKELRAAVRRLAVGVSKRSGIPAITGIRAEYALGRLTLASTDLEVSITTEIDGTVEVDHEAWAVLIPAKMIGETLRNHKAETVSILPDGPRTVAAGAGSIRTLPLEDFPTLLEPRHLVASIPSADFAAAVDAVGPAVSKDEARPVLTGMFLELEASGEVRWTATDSYRLHHFETGGAMLDARMIIPGRALSAVRKAIGRKPAGNVAVFLDADMGAVRMLTPDGVSTTVRLIEGEFPNYRQLIPDPHAVNVDGLEVVGRLEPGTLAEVIRAAAPYCSEVTPIRLELNGTVLVSASSADLGEYRAEVIGAEYNGPEVVIGFNPYYIGPTLEAYSGPVYVRDGLKPATVGNVDFERSGGRFGLVMPVRIGA